MVEHDQSPTNMADHGMKMYFHAGMEETVLFQVWRIDSTPDLVISCLGVILLCMLYEGLKYVRLLLDKRFFHKCCQTKSAEPVKTSEVSTLLDSSATPTKFQHAVQTLLHMVQTFLSLCIMLVFMTYNVYLCLSVVLGAGLGYAVFGWFSASNRLKDDHCGGGPES